MNWITTLFSNALFVSLLAILLLSIVGIYINARARDRCLRDFDGYVVTILDSGGKVMWGQLRVYSSGLELFYLEEEEAEDGHVENSTILYNSDQERIQALYRLHDHQPPLAHRRREVDIRRVYRPSLWRCGARGLRNLLSTFKDALVQTVGTFLGYRAMANPQNPLLSQHKQLIESSAQVLSGVAGNAYEPILEQHIGHYVVLEITEEESVEAEYGILKEYSNRYLELLNVKLEVPLPIYFQMAEQDAMQQIQIQRTAEGLVITHRLPHAIHMDAIRCGQQRRPIDLLLAPGTPGAVPLLEDELRAQTVPEFSVRCLADLIVPRTLGVVRHGGKREKLPLPVLLGLDQLPRLPWVRRLVGSQRRPGRDAKLNADTRSVDARPE